MDRSERFHVDIDTFSQPLEAQWNLPLDHGSLQKLISGYPKKQMEDRWCIMTEGPERHGETKGIYSVFIAGSWIRRPIINLKIEAKLDSQGEPQQGAVAWIREIIWETDPKKIWGALGPFAEGVGVEEARKLTRGHFLRIADIQLADE